MKLSIPRTELVAALNIVKGAVDSRGSMPIMSNVALSTTGAKLELTGNNLKLLISTKVKADVDDKGGCTVNAALLHGLVHSFTGDDPVELQALKTELKINCGASKYRLGTLPTEDFPPDPKLKDPVEFELPQHELRGMLNATRFCQGRDEQRYVLCGSFIKVNHDLTVASCDGRRVAVQRSQLDKSKKLPETVMNLPAKTVAELIRLLSAAVPEDDSKTETVKVTVTASHAQFQLGDIVIISQLIDGNYPNYEQVIPDNVDGVPVSRVDMSRALHRVALISANSCTLEFEGQSLTIRSRGGKEVPGDAVETLLIPKTRKVTVAFNTQYLIEALDAVADDQVTLHVEKATKPLVIKSPSHDWLCVTMCLSDKPDKISPPAEEPAAAPATETKPEEKKAA